MSISGMPQRGVGRGEHEVAAQRELEPAPIQTPSTAAMVMTSVRFSSIAAVSWNMLTMR